MCLAAAGSEGVVAIGYGGARMGVVGSLVGEPRFRLEQG